MMILMRVTHEARYKPACVFQYELLKFATNFLFWQKFCQIDCNMASSEDIVNDLTVKEIKLDLKSRGLKVTGLKKELKERLCTVRNLALTLYCMGYEAGDQSGGNLVYRL